MPAKKLIIPPGGFAGYGQQTQATQAMFGNAVKPKTRRKVRRKKVAKKRPVRRKKATTRRKKSAGKRLVKGSAAAKRRMAQLRKMRRK